MDSNPFGSFWFGMELPERRELAKRSGISEGYLYLVANGIRNAGSKTAAKLKAADNRITDTMLRPDLYPPMDRS